jgi:hypothetical protein
VNKRTVLFFVLTLALLPIENSFAAGPKGGASCPEVGVVQIYKSKKYTCIRSKGKIVWNKGVTVTSPTPSPTLTHIRTLVAAAKPRIVGVEYRELKANWIVGTSINSFVCWKGINSSSLVGLQIKKNGNWQTKQLANVESNSSLCTTDYPNAALFDWVVDEFGEESTSGRAKNLMTRSVILNIDGSVSVETNPIVVKVYTSEYDQSADFLDWLNEMMGQGSSANSNSSSSGLGSSSKFANCMYKGKKLYGRIQVVNYLPDIKVQVVDYLADLKVQKVDYLPTSCGKWQFVDYLPDLKVQFVDYLADLKIQYVSYLPGLTRP